MKNTRDAIKFGLENLGISPDDLFSLIETSNGYTGEDYSRWLANEIIKIAEKDGIGYSQLLVKKFSIIQSMSEEVDAIIKDKWISKFREVIGVDNIYSVNFEGIGDELEEIDWFNGIDYDDVNSYFASEVLPEELYQDIVNDNELCIITKLSGDTASKNCDLAKSAKELNISCKSVGSLMLYRMCSLVDTFNCSKNFRFAFLVNKDFLTSSENRSIISYFSKHFDHKGFVLKSRDLFEESYLSNEFAFVMCTPKTVDSKNQDGFKLKYLNGDEITIKQYGHSEVSLIDVLAECKPSTETLGYMCIYPNGKITLSSEEDFNFSKKCIPINKDNFRDVVIYYAVYSSLGYFGISGEIKCLMTGHSSYEKLYANCLPLFVYDENNEIEGIQLNEFILSELAKCEVFYSYESKEVVSTCKGFIDFLSKEEKGISSFQEVRKSANHEDLNELYVSSIRNLKDYIKILYREME